MEVIMQMGNELLVNLLVGVLSVLAALAICGVQKGIVYLKQQTAQLKDDGLRPGGRRAAGRGDGRQHRTDDGGRLA